MQVAEWTYLALTGLQNGPGGVTQAVVMGDAGAVVWFYKSGGAFVPRFGLRDKLSFDGGTQLFRHATPEGLVTFYSNTGGLVSQQDQAGNTLSVVSRAANGFNLGEKDFSWHRVAQRRGSGGRGAQRAG